MRTWQEVWYRPHRMMAIAWLAVWAAGASVVAPPAQPHRRIDRMRVVGGPVLEADARPGIYVWVEDGFIQFAAVAKSERRHRMQVKVESSAAIDFVELGDFRTSAVGPQRMVLETVVQMVPARARLKTGGEVVVSEARIGEQTAPIFVGPMSELAARRVRIGRY